MNNKLVHKILLAAVAALLFACPQIANAEPPVPNVSGDLEVNVVGKGTVTGTGISCPGDCLQSATWKENETPASNTLTAASTASGWAFQGWEGACSVQTNKAVCKSGYGTEEPFVSTAEFIDVMAPSIFLSSFSPADEVGNSIYAGVVTSDNDQVTKVEYLIDGQVVSSVTSAPWYASIDTSTLSDGEHQLQARAYDPTGNNGITANRPTVVDHAAPVVSLDSPVSATGATAPAFSFSSNSPDFHSAECDIFRKGAGSEENACEPDAAYSEETPEEGTWIFEVDAYDHVGNKTVKQHEFVVDRTDPAVTFTGGPDDGATVDSGDVSYSWSTDDATMVGETCSVDGGPKERCSHNADLHLDKGTHRFELVSTDSAGNTSTASRAVTVKTDGTDPDDPDDPDGPDKPGSRDLTAPVVTLATGKQKLKALKKGLRVKVSCDEACAGTVKAKAKGGVRFTGKVGLTAAGVAKARLKPNAKAKRALKKATPLKLTVVSRLSDTAGNQAVSKLKTRVKK